MVLRYSKETAPGAAFATVGINQRPGDAAAGVAVETGVIVTCSILSSRTFWTFA